MDKNAIIGLIVIVVTVILFLIPKVPILFTCIFGILVFYLSGIATVGEVFSGFNSSATWVLVGISLFSGAFFSSGLGAFLGKKIAKLCRGNEKLCIVVIYVVVSILSGFVNGLAMYLMFRPLVDSICAESEGRIDTRLVSMTLSVACLLGGSISLMGASSILATSGMYESYSPIGAGFSFFETAKLGIPMFVVGLIYYLFIYQRLGHKVLTDFTANTGEMNATEAPERMNLKMWITLVIFLVSIYCFIFTKINMAIVCFIMAALCLALGIVSEKEAIAAVPWHGTLCMICMLGFATGVEVSGAGRLIGEAMLKFANTVGLGAYGVCVLILLTAVIISNFMSNNAAVTVVFPIAMGVSTVMGANPLPFAVATAVGANGSYATPLAAPLLTMNLAVGYGFKHYVKGNGLVNLMTLVACAIALRVFYF